VFQFQLKTKAKITVEPLLKLTFHSLFIVLSQLSRTFAHDLAETFIRLSNQKNQEIETSLKQ